MKLPVTDQLLWDIYNFVEKLSDVHDVFTPRTWKDILCPEMRQIWRAYDKKMSRQRFSRLAHYLKKNGYIKIKNLDNKQGVLITQKGGEKILKIKLKKMEKKKRTDKKWQMLIFDIPEDKRVFRDILRSNLIFLGYSLLQKSVWVSPYDVLGETENMIRKYELDPYVRLFLIEEI